MCKHTILNEVRAELKKHPGVIASVNTETGEARAFILPKPYWETASNAPGDADFSLTPEQVRALESERAALIGKLPSLGKADGAKARTRIGVIESELRRARSNDEAKRVDREREKERERQRIGDEQTAPRPSGNTSSKTTWEALRAKLAAMSLPAETICCKGKYLCARCKAKSAA